LGALQLQIVASLILFTQSSHQQNRTGGLEECQQMPLEKLPRRWVANYKPKPEPKASTMPGAEAPHEPEPSVNVGPSTYPPPASYELIWSTYKPYKAATIIADLDSEDDDDADDELDRYLEVKPAFPAQRTNPIRWWLDRKADYRNLSRMAIDYLIIPSGSVVRSSILLTRYHQHIR